MLLSICNYHNNVRIFHLLSLCTWNASSLDSLAWLKNCVVFSNLKYDRPYGAAPLSPSLRCGQVWAVDETRFRLRFQIRIQRRHPLNSLSLCSRRYTYISLRLKIDSISIYVYDFSGFVSSYFLVMFNT